MRAAFPQLLALEAQHRSLILALRRRPRGDVATLSPFVALPGGMTDLITALWAALQQESMQLGVGVNRIERAVRGYLLRLTDGTSARVDTVLLATPPPAVARLAQAVD